MFHVPSAYRLLDGPLASDTTYGNNGAFRLPTHFAGRTPCIIASDGFGWEHVSVHIQNARRRSLMPNWDEMCYIKNVFWDKEDTVMQLHPAQSQWVNNHPMTLHLWRPITAAIPCPPAILVGVLKDYAAPERA